MNPTYTCEYCGQGHDVHPDQAELCQQLQELRKAAREVRHFQKVYFGTRTKEALQAAKNAERKLDQVLEKP